MGEDYPEEGPGGDGGPSSGPAAEFPTREVERAVGRELSGRAGGPRHAGWALRSNGRNKNYNCYALKEFARQMHTTIKGCSLRGCEAARSKTTYAPGSV